MSPADSKNPYQPTGVRGEGTRQIDGEFRCKNCGNRSFQRVRPEARFAFAKDYRCLECLEQVPAPVPIWGVVIMSIGGLGIASIGSLLLLVNLFRGGLIGLVLGGG
ncbi:MAG: hypothetical protein AAFX06_28090, partial [Planctomycetota bacterium]